MLNKVMLMGRLTADPVLRQTQSNLSVTTFTLAVNRNYAKKDGSRDVDFIDIVCWRNTADFVAKYFKKGQQVVVSGSLQTRTWQDNNGNNRKAVEVVADEVFFAEGKRDSGAPVARNDAPTESAAPAFVSDDTDDFLELSGQDDLPF